jgi:hypothetical protein
VPRCPSFNLIREEEIEMIGAQDAPIAHIAEALVEITLAVGLTEKDVLDLLVTGMKVTDLLNYAEAVALNRLN